MECLQESAYPQVGLVSEEMKRGRISSLMQTVQIFEKQWPEVRRCSVKNQKKVSETMTRGTAYYGMYSHTFPRSVRSGFPDADILP